MSTNNNICVGIPSRNELFLCHSINNIYQTADHPEQIKIVVVVDGWDFEVKPGNDKYSQERIDCYKRELDQLHNLEKCDRFQITIIKHDQPQGVRVAFNKAAAITDCKYVFKIDSHIEMCPGWDTKAKQSYDNSGMETLLIPRIRSWEPSTGEYGRRLFGSWFLDREVHQHYWQDYMSRIPENQLEWETMANLGASWFTSQQYWFQMGGHDESLYIWGESAPETSLKCWLFGGRQIVRRDFWFAHLFRRQFPYQISGSAIKHNKNVIKQEWTGEPKPGQIHDLQWLADKFAPVPTWDN